MPKFEYTFEIEEKVIKRCSIVVEAPFMATAMREVEENGPWSWDVHYGKDLSYEAEELMGSDPNDTANWRQVND